MTSTSLCSNIFDENCYVASLVTKTVNINNYFHCALADLERPQKVITLRHSLQLTINKVWKPFSLKAPFKTRCVLLCGWSLGGFRSSEGRR